MKTLSPCFRSALFVLFALVLLAPARSRAQVICNPNGNLVLFTNYDGGMLNIYVDVNIPNLKIGVVSYEAVSINLTGPFVNNVNAVHYAGYNSQNNNNCSPTVATTVISGAPGGATTNIVFAPASPLSNANGYPSIICGYSCNTGTSQGGCNTIDQIEAYFASVFPGSVLRQHKVQYGCWTGPQQISPGGTCCLAASPMQVQVSVVAPSCIPLCNGSATGTVSGGTAPYSWQWTPGPASATYTNMCPGNYVVTVTDANNATATANVVIPNGPSISTTINQNACSSFFFNGMNLTNSGTYYDTLQTAQGCDSVIVLNLTITNLNATVSQAGNILTASPAGAASYTWVQCPMMIPMPAGNQQVYNAPGPGQYAVIISQGGCTDTSSCVTVVSTGLNREEAEPELKLWPNPVRDVLHIEANGLSRLLNLTLYDGSGRVLKRCTLSGSGTMDLQGIGKGVYYLEAEGGKKRWRVVK